MRRVLKDHDVDADAVFADIASGAALEQVRIEHTASAEDYNAWGCRPSCRATGPCSCG